MFQLLRQIKAFHTSLPSTPPSPAHLPPQHTSLPSTPPSPAHLLHSFKYCLDFSGTSLWLFCRFYTVYLLVSHRVSHLVCGICARSSLLLLVMHSGKWSRQHLHWLMCVLWSHCFKVDPRYCSLLYLQVCSNRSLGVCQPMSVSQPSCVLCVMFTPTEALVRVLSGFEGVQRQLLVQSHTECFFNSAFWTYNAVNVCISSSASCRSDYFWFDSPFNSAEAQIVYVSSFSRCFTLMLQPYHHGLTVTTSCICVTLGDPGFLCAACPSIRLCDIQQVYVWHNRL